MTQKQLALRDGNLCWGGVKYTHAMLVKRFGANYARFNESLNICCELPCLNSEAVFNSTKFKFETNFSLN